MLTRTRTRRSFRPTLDGMLPPRIVPTNFPPMDPVPVDPPVFLPMPDVTTSTGTVSPSSATAFTTPPTTS